MQPGVFGLLRLQVVEIGRRQRHDAGAQRRGRRPLVLPRLGIDPVRERDEGEALAQPRTQGLLVGRVRVGMEQRDGDRLGAARLDAPDRVFHRVRVQRGHDPAVVVEPLGHLEAALGGDLGLELGRQVETVEVAPVLATDGERIREPAGGDQRDLRVVALDDGVGDDGGAVYQVVHVTPFEIDRAERREQACDAVVGAGGNLRGPDLAARPVLGDHVGKRAADIDTDLPSTRHGAASGCRVAGRPFRGPSRRPELSNIENSFDYSITMRPSCAVCQHEFGSGWGWTIGNGNGNYELVPIGGMPEDIMRHQAVVRREGLTPIGTVTF